MALLNQYVIEDDSDMAYAELFNLPNHSSLGNQVISGCGVTEQATPDLTVAVASGSVIVGGLVKNVTAGNVDLSTEQGALSSGQARFAYIYIDSTGAISKLAGIAATAGQQYPPAFSSLPDDCVLLARVLLTEGDTAINTADIKDMRLNVPKGIYSAGKAQIGALVSNGIISIDTSIDGLRTIDDGNTAAKMLWNFSPGTNATDWRFYLAPRDTSDAGWNWSSEFGWDQANQRWYIENYLYMNGTLLFPDNKYLQLGSSGDLQLYHDGTKNLVKSTTSPIWIYTTVGDVILRSGDSIIFTDDDSSGAYLFQLDTTNRTVKFGTISNPLQSYFYRNIMIYSPETGKTDRRFTINVDNADLLRLYNYNEGSAIFEDIKIGSTNTNEGIYWDALNKRVGINDDTPSYALDINGGLRATFHNIQETVQLYPNIRIVTGWAWSGTDNYIFTPNDTNDYDAYVYLNIKDTLQSIDVSVNYTEVGSNVDGSIDITLEERTTNGAWTNISTISVTTTGDSIATLSPSITLDASKQYRLKVTKNYVSGGTSNYAALYGVTLHY